MACVIATTRRRRLHAVNLKYAPAARAPCLALPCLARARAQVRAREQAAADPSFRAPPRPPGAPSSRRALWLSRRRRGRAPAAPAPFPPHHINTQKLANDAHTQTKSKTISRAENPKEYRTYSRNAFRVRAPAAAAAEIDKAQWMPRGTRGWLLRLSGDFFRARGRRGERPCGTERARGARPFPPPPPLRRRPSRCSMQAMQAFRAGVRRAAQLRAPAGNAQQSRGMASAPGVDDFGPLRAAHALGGKGGGRVVVGRGRRSRARRAIAAPSR